MTGDGAYDVLTMGRIGVDIYPLQVGVPLADVTSFGKWLGGTATNVAVAAARYGRRTAVISRVGDDPFGVFVHRALCGYGVDDRYVTAVGDLPTPVTFCEIFPPDDFPIYFYRYPKAPDLEIRTDELDIPAISAARVLWTTLTGLCEQPSRDATLAALATRRPEQLTVLDLDWRPMFWPSATEGGELARRALAHVSVAVGNLAECEVAVGSREPRVAADRLRELGARIAVVKLGPDGVLAVDDDGEVLLPPVPVEVVNGLGAGDAFGGALCHGLLAGWPLDRIMRYANTAGAIVASRLACSDAMPTAGEVEAGLEVADG